jgi:hypothetical protein
MNLFESLTQVPEVESTNKVKILEIVKKMRKFALKSHLEGTVLYLAKTSGSKAKDYG